MPPVFAPAQPMSAAIAEGYGRTLQSNQTLPTIARLQEAAAQRQLAQEQMAHQAMMGSMQNQTQAALQRDALDNRLQLQQNEQQFRGRALGQQLDFDRERLYVGAALEGTRVGQKELMQAQQQEAGLAELANMVQDGTLDLNRPEDKQLYHDAMFRLKSGSNLTQQRYQQQQIRDGEAQAHLRDQQVARMKRAEEMTSQMERDLIQSGETTLKWMDENTGRVHLLIKNKNNGQWYNPLESHAKMKEDQQAPSPDNEWGHLAQKGTNKLDEPKAMANAEKWAKFNVDPIYDQDGKVNKEATDKAIKERARARFDGIKREFKEAEEGKSPEKPAEVPAEKPQDKMSGERMKAQVDVAAERAKKDVEKLNPEQQRIAKGLIDGMNEIMKKYPSLDAAPPEERAKYMNYRNMLGVYMPRRPQPQFPAGGAIAQPD